MKVRFEIPIEEAFTLEERKNFEANARLAGRDMSSHLRAILFPRRGQDGGECVGMGRKEKRGEVRV